MVLTGWAAVLLWLQAGGWIDVWAVTTELLVPGTVGAAGVAVAIASWATSRRATRIAADAASAETNRAAHEAKRLEDERRERYEWRLDEAMVKVIAETSSLRLLLLKIVEMQSNGKRTVEISLEARDQQFATSSEIVATRMLARGIDEEVLALAARALTASANHLPNQRLKLVNAITAVLTDWRNGSADRVSDAVQTLEAIAAGGKIR